MTSMLDALKQLQRRGIPIGGSDRSKEVRKRLARDGVNPAEIYVSAAGADQEQHREAKDPAITAQDSSEAAMPTDPTSALEDASLALLEEAVQEAAGIGEPCDGPGVEESIQDEDHLEETSQDDHGSPEAIVGGPHSSDSAADIPQAERQVNDLSSASSTAFTLEQNRAGTPETASASVPETQEPSELMLDDEGARLVPVAECSSVVQQTDAIQPADDGIDADDIIGQPEALQREQPEQLEQLEHTEQLEQSKQQPEQRYLATSGDGASEVGPQADGQLDPTPIQQHAPEPDRDEQAELEATVISPIEEVTLEASPAEPSGVKSAPADPIDLEVVPSELPELEAPRQPDESEASMTQPDDSEALTTQPDDLEAALRLAVGEQTVLAVDSANARTQNDAAVHMEHPSTDSIRLLDAGQFGSVEAVSLDIGPSCEAPDRDAAWGLDDDISRELEPPVSDESLDVLELEAATDPVLPEWNDGESLNGSVDEVATADRDNEGSTPGDEVPPEAFIEIDDSSETLTDSVADAPPVEVPLPPRERVPHAYEIALENELALEHGMSRVTVQSQLERIDTQEKTDRTTELHEEVASLRDQLGRLEDLMLQLIEDQPAPADEVPAPAETMDLECDASLRDVLSTAVQAAVVANKTSPTVHGVEVQAGLSDGPGEEQANGISSADTVTGSTTPSELVSAEREDNSGETVPDATLPGETVPEATVPEDVQAEEVVPDEMLPEEMVILPEGLVAEEIFPEEVVPEETETQDLVPEQAAYLTVLDQEMPDQTVAEETVLSEAMAEQMVAEGTSAEETLTEGTVTNDTVPQQMWAEELVSEEMVMRDLQLAEDGEQVFQHLGGPVDEPSLHEPHLAMSSEVGAVQVGEEWDRLGEDEPERFDANVETWGGKSSTAFFHPPASDRSEPNTTDDLDLKVVNPESPNDFDSHLVDAERSDDDPPAAPQFVSHLSTIAADGSIHRAVDAADDPVVEEPTGHELNEAAPSELAKSISDSDPNATRERILTVLGAAPESPNDQDLAGDPIFASDHGLAEVSDPDRVLPSTTAYELVLQSNLENAELTGQYGALWQQCLYSDSGSHHLAVAAFGCHEEPHVAQVMAQLGCMLARRESQRVLLVDGNVTTQTLTKSFEASDRPGLAEIAAGSRSWRDCVVETATPTLSVIPGGLDIAQDFDDSLLARCVEEWSTAFDFVLMDAGSIGSLMLKPLVAASNRALILVRLGKTRREDATASVHAIRELNLKTHGCIVTNIESLQ